MKIVKIGELKNRLSHYLRQVQQGESILVADRDRVIARIDRVSEPAGLSESDAEWIDRLERKGVIRRPIATLPKDWLARAPKIDADLVAAVLKEREEGP